MAADAVARRVTELHRAQQLAISRNVAARVLEQWGTVDPAEIDASWRRVAAALADIVEAGHAASVQAASAYLHLHAALYGVTLPTVAVPSFNAQQVDASLRVTGPVALKRATGNGAGLDGAMSVASTTIQGAATRLSLQGGRSTVHDTVEQSDGLIGYRRVGDGHSCNFCDMLISRDVFYKFESATTVVGRSGRPRGNQQLGSSFHDHCGCSPEPVYAGQGEPPEVQAAYQRYLERRAAGSDF